MESKFDVELREISSAERGDLLMDILFKLEKQPNRYYRILQEWWSSCDHMGHLVEDFKILFENQGSVPYEKYTKDNKRFYDSLPEEFTIYRGCGADASDGLSWTTDKKIAYKFARGHRYIPVKRPRLLSATIRKSWHDIVFVSNDRKESEVVLNCSKDYDATVLELTKTDIEAELGEPNAPFVYLPTGT